MNFFNQELVHHLGLTLLHFIWQGLLVGLVYGLILLVWRPASANARYHLAVATLATLAALPALTLGWLATRTEAGATAVTGAAESFAIAASSSLNTGSSGDPMIWIVAAWLAGVILLSARLAMGWHHVLRLRRSADFAATEALSALVDSTRRRLAIGRKVILAASAKVRAPLVIGYFKPLILFPPAMVNHLSLEQIEMVLAHEMAHIRRHDHLVNLFQTVVETLLFYHPVVAWVSRQIRIERENACDDLAVDVTGNRLGYVEMLASLERLRHPVPRLALSIQDGQIVGRIRRLVEPRQPSRQRGLTLPALAVVILVASTTAVYLVPDSEQDDASPAVAGEPVESAAPAMRSNEPERDDQPVEVEQDPLSWDFPSLDTADLENNGADRAVANSADQVVSNEQRAPEPAAIPETVAAEDRPAPAEPAPAQADARQTATAVVDIPEPTPESPPAEPAELSVAAESPLQLAALPHPARPRPEAPRVAEVEPPPITGGQLVHQVKPRFPMRARQRQVSGLVELEFTVTGEGRTREIRVLDESQRNLGFAEAAMAAVAEWRFEPFRQGDEVLNRLVRVEIEFNPDDACVTKSGSRVPRC